MIEIVTFLAYILASYGFANMIVYSSGPFGIFEHWRNISHMIHPRFGELFTCMMCISTWIGLALSLINIFILPGVGITPFNMILSSFNVKPLICVLDMGFTSGIVWLLHQLEEMFERIGTYKYLDEETNE